MLCPFIAFSKILTTFFPTKFNWCLSVHVHKCVFLHICLYVLRRFTHLSESTRICSLLILLCSMRRSKSSSMMLKNCPHFLTERHNCDIKSCAINSVQSGGQSLTRRLAYLGFHTMFHKDKTHPGKIFWLLQCLAHFSEYSRILHSFVEFNTN